MDKVIIMQDWYRALAQQPRDVRVEVYDAIMEYGFSGKFPSQLKPLAMGMFLLIQPQMDRMQEQYDQKAAKRSAAGKKGMAGRWKKPPDDSQGENADCGSQTITKITNITNDNSDNKNNKAYQAITSDNNKIKENKINFSEKECDKSHSKESIAAKMFLNCWNNHCGQYGLPRIRELTDKRKRKIALRLKEFEAAGHCDLGKAASLQRFLLDLCMKICRSPFLRGESASGWRANFDWLIENGDSWRKILDGNYDNNNANSGAGGTSGMFTGEQAAAIVAAGESLHERQSQAAEPL